MNRYDLKNRLLAVTIGFAALISFTLSQPVLAQKASDKAAKGKKPNFIVILADDLGWADLGVMGSEIRTPNLDRLAGRGTLMSQFYTAPTCAPTRAMLMTGLSNHEAGVGTQHSQQVANQLGSVVYDAQLHDGIVTVAEGLKSAGYQTMMSGKWHIGRKMAQYPHSRGFDRSFVLLEGGASHFEDMMGLNPAEPPRYIDDGKFIDKLPEGFYSTTHYTDKMLGYFDQRDKTKPFFAYLAYTAPHDPLQVPDNWLNVYRGVYDDGPEKVRARRIEKLREKDLFPETAVLAEGLALPRIFPGAKKPWDERSLHEKRVDTRPIEIYAAMVEILDQNIGRLIDHLDAQGELENSYIIFMSDNGASAVTPLAYPETSREWLHEERNMHPNHAGRAGSHTYIDAEWAQVLNGPNRLFKAMMMEGGIRAPLIIAGPQVTQGAFNKQIGHISDITPSLYELAGLEAHNMPIYADKPKPRGQSLVPVWQGRTMLRDAPIFGELFGNSMVRDGDWKLVKMDPPFGDGDWALFDMKNDPGESENVIATHPEIAAQLQNAYEKYAEEVGIIAPQPPIIRDISVLYTGKCDMLCEARIGALKLIINPVTRWLIIAAILIGLGLIIRRRFRPAT